MKHYTFRITVTVRARGLASALTKLGRWIKDRRDCTVHRDGDGEIKVQHVSAEKR